MEDQYEDGENQLLELVVCINVITNDSQAMKSGIR